MKEGPGLFGQESGNKFSVPFLVRRAPGFEVTRPPEPASLHRSPYGFGRGLSEEPLSEEKKDSYIATQLMYLIGIANKVAFSVTYGEHLELNTLTSLGGGKNTFLDSAKLWRELKHIRYNLISNGGNYFLAQRWDQLLTDIIEGLAANVVRAPLARCPASP